MNVVDQRPRRATASELQRVIEPLASYICANDQPKTVLKMAYSVLFNEVAQVNRAAREQVATFARGISKKATQPIDPGAPGSTRR